MLLIEIEKLFTSLKGPWVLYRMILIAKKKKEKAFYPFLSLQYIKPGLVVFRKLQSDAVMPEIERVILFFLYIYKYIYIQRTPVENRGYKNIGFFHQKLYFLKADNLTNLTPQTIRKSVHY